MGPPASQRIPRVRWYSGYWPLASSFIYRTLTFFGSASHPIRLDSTRLRQSSTPWVFLLSVWPLALSLATTRRISFDFFSSGYLDVSVPRVPYVNLCIQLTFHGSSPWGFPHSEIHGSMLIYSSPWLIAVSHVLLRLLMPRHSPYALGRLNFSQLYNCLFSLWIAWVSLNKFLFQVIFSVKRYFVYPFLCFPPFGEIVILPF